MPKQSASTITLLAPVEFSSPDGSILYRGFNVAPAVDKGDSRVWAKPESWRQHHDATPYGRIASAGAKRGHKNQSHDLDHKGHVIAIVSVKTADDGKFKARKPDAYSFALVKTDDLKPWARASNPVPPANSENTDD